jgi:hypothetical protein
MRHGLGAQEEYEMEIAEKGKQGNVGLRGSI